LQKFDVAFEEVGRALSERPKGMTATALRS
jgi:hypothetical protein